MKHINILFAAVAAASIISGPKSSAASMSAEANLESAAPGITVYAVNRPATEVFDEIMRQTDKNFIYQSDLLKGVKVTVNLSNVSLKSVLSEMFSGTGIEYKIKGKNIVLSKKAPQKSATQPVPQSKKVRHTLSGFVREEGSGEVLAGALVAVPGTQLASYSNAMGFYSLSVPQDARRLTVSYPGFRTDTIIDLKITADRTLDFSLMQNAEELREVVVEGSRNNTIAMETASVGALNVGRDEILRTPVVFGESDIIKTLQYEPGISAGIEGTAGMYVHGGNTDENQYMLDNIPLYQVNHFGGLFSAFNTQAIRNVDFHRSSFPAKFDGRLSSYMDVHTKDGSMTEHHGSLKLGLTSGTFNIDGPIWRDHTSYSVAVRRSWYDLLTIPAFAIYNSISKGNKYHIGYAFTDINAKINHRFTDRSRAYVMCYFGEDYLKYREKWDYVDDSGDWYEEKSSLRWGNLVVSAGWNYVISPTLFAEFTGAYTRYASHLTHEYSDGYNEEGTNTDELYDLVKSKNRINDWIVKADFDWHPHPAHHLEFGAGYTFHDFLPSLTKRKIVSDDYTSEVSDRVNSYRARELNAYFGGDWQPVSNLRINYGAHYSLFNIDGKSHSNLSPRLSARWTPAEGWAVKAGYSRTVQYVHQLIQSSISLPTDQWVPITGDFKPQTADKVFAGIYHSFGRGYTLSVEAYYKRMHNLVEYADEYYILPPDTEWTQKLTPGKGTSKGIDFRIEKDFGAVSGHVAYALMWADRQYADKNGGKKFPARFDNRHKINVLLNWKINKKWEMSAAWTGMSGNRITLPTQCWYDPSLAPWNYEMMLRTEVNNFRLPFFHRLDLNFRRNTAHGYWDFSLYNAYCNMNTIAVRRDISNEISYDQYGNMDWRPVFQKICLIPVIPSVSYTWIF